MTAISNCVQCGLNVPTPTTTYSLQGDLNCRNCSSRDGLMQQVGRARDAANEHAIGGGLVGAVRQIQAQGMHAEVDRLETEIAQELSVDIANAQAVSFTCKPCGGTFPLEEGAYTPDRRVLCKPCFAADAEARRLKASSGLTGMQTIAVIVVVAAILGGIIYWLVS